MTVPVVSGRQSRNWISILNLSPFYNVTQKVGSLFICRKIKKANLIYGYQPHLEHGKLTNPLLYSSIGYSHFSQGVVFTIFNSGGFLY